MRLLPILAALAPLGAADLTIDGGSVTYIENAAGCRLLQLGALFTPQGSLDGSQIQWRITNGSRFDDRLVTLPITFDDGITVEVARGAIVYTSTNATTGVTVTRTIGEAIVPSTATGTAFIRFNGAADLPAAQRALQVIAFSNLGDDPQHQARTITYDLRSASGSLVATRTNTVVPSEENDPPVTRPVSYPLVGRPDTQPLRDTDFIGTLPLTDPDSPVLDSRVVVSPAHGRLTISADGRSFTYRPDAGYVGADTFSFDTFDGLTTSPAAIVSLEVVEPPSGDYSFSTMEGRTLRGTLAPLVSGATFAAVSGPLLGSLVFDPDQQGFTYTPRFGQAGIDRIVLETRGLSGSQITVPMSVTIGQWQAAARPRIVSMPAREQVTAGLVWQYALDVDVSGYAGSTPVSVSVEAQDLDAGGAIIPFVRTSGVGGVFTLTTQATWTGSRRIQVRVWDPTTMASDLQDIVIIITAGGAG